jgi:hypothetical protein
MPVKYIGGDDPEWQAFRALKLFARSVGEGHGLTPAQTALLLVNVAAEVIFEASVAGKEQENADGLKQAIQEKLEAEMQDRAIGQPMGRA